MKMYQLVFCRRLFFVSSFLGISLYVHAVPEITRSVSPSSGSASDTESDTNSTAGPSTPGIPTIVLDVPAVPATGAGCNLLLKNIAKLCITRAAGAAYCLAECGARCLLEGGYPTDLQDNLFAELTHMDLPHGFVAKEQPDCVFQNSKVPPVLAAYLMGRDIEGGTLNAVIKHLDHSSLQKNKKKVYKGIAELIFTPEQLAQSVKADDVTVKLLCDIRQTHQEVRFILASSLPNIQELKKQQSMIPLFDLSTRVVSSADLKLLRPAPAFYLALKLQLSLDPAQTIFIENEPQYARTAQLAGFTHAVCWTQPGVHDEIKALVNKIV